MGRPAAYEDVDGEEHDDEQRHDEGGDHVLPADVGLLLCYLRLLLLGLVDGGQLGGYVAFLPGDGRVEGVEEPDGRGDGRVGAVGSDVGAELGQQVELNVVERKRDVVLMQLRLGDSEVVGGLVPALCRYEVAGGLDDAVPRLGILRVAGFLVGLGCFLRASQPL